MRPRSRRLRPGAEGAAALDVGGIDHLSVPLDVAARAADDEQHQLLVLRPVGYAARRGRLDVEKAAWAELEHLVANLDAGAAAVDEVELVLRVVEWLNPTKPGGKTMALTPKAVTPSARRTLRKPGPSPSSSIELNA